MTGEMLKGHLDLLLLSAVAQGPAHGYELIERLAARSGGAFDLAEGTVYPALHRLEEAGLLSSHWSPAREGARRRRVYALTRSGKTALTDRSEQWRQFVAGIDAVLGGGPWPRPI